MEINMEKLSMCRICLSGGSRLRSIVETHLQEMYESLTLMLLVTEDARPSLACDLCCSRLETCYELRRTSLRSENLFMQFLDHKVQVKLEVLPDASLSMENVTQSTADVLESLDSDDVKQEDVEDNSAVEQDDTELYHNALGLHTECDIPLVIVKEESDVDDDNSAVEQDDTELYHNALGLHTECDIPLVIVKEESDVDDDNSAVEQDDTELYHNALGLHTECDIPLVIVKEESDVDDGAPVCTDSGLTTQMNYEDTPANNLTKDNIREPKSETKRAVEDKPVEKNKMETHDKIDIRLPNNKQNDSTSDHNDAYKKTSENKISADQSVNSSPSNKIKQLLCDTCQKCFRCKGDLIIHVRTHTGEKPYQCNICETYFSVKGNLDRHTRTHTGEKPYKCNVCKKCFSHKIGLDIHMRAHTDENHPYQCNICKKYFSLKGNLDRHTRTHTGEKPYKCNVCKKCFNHKIGLDIHMRAHTGENHPYQCNICKKYFSVKCNLDRHTRTHTGEKPYKCNVCKKCFNRKICLDIHMRAHTGENHPYQCNICKKYFSVKGKLDRHTRTHTGEKPYKCYVCKECFNRKDHLDRHTRKHTHEKPYQCNVRNISVKRGG